MYETLFKRLETQYAIITSRRTAGLACSAKLEIPFVVVDVISARNLFIQQRGLVGNRTLRVTNSTVKSWMEDWLRALTAQRTLDVDALLTERRGDVDGGDFFEFGASGC